MLLTFPITTTFSTTTVCKSVSSQLRPLNHNPAITTFNRTSHHNSAKTPQPSLPITEQHLLMTSIKSISLQFIATTIILSQHHHNNFRQPQVSSTTIFINNNSHKQQFSSTTTLLPRISQSTTRTSKARTTSGFKKDIISMEGHHGGGRILDIMEASQGGKDNITEVSSSPSHH
jgi:hypothetical protein